MTVKEAAGTPAKSGSNYEEIIRQTEIQEHSTKQLAYI